MKILKTILSISILIGIEGCSVKNKNWNQYASQMEMGIKSVINSDSEDPIHNAVALVEGKKFKWKGSAGNANGSDETMTPDHKIKIASITKTFTATIILQLIEEDMIGLDDTIDKYLDDEIVKIDSLVVFNGESYGRKVSVKHLLSHTSGIRDYMEDDRFIPGVLENPLKQYNPQEILKLYYEYDMNKKAFFKPGEKFDYSDVNYVLLAMIIEKVTKSNYHEVLLMRIFEPLNMNNSYLEYYEKPRGQAPLSHAYFSTIDLINEVNTSFDWGGGGIISTCEDLNTFIRALLNGKLFRNNATLEIMINEAEKGRGGMDYAYGFGIQKRIIHGSTFYGHGGAYDCDLFYCPDKDLSVVFSLNQMNTHGKRDQLLFDLIKLSSDYQKFIN